MVNLYRTSCAGPPLCKTFLFVEPPVPDLLYRSSPVPYLLFGMPLFHTSFLVCRCSIPPFWYAFVPYLLFGMPDPLGQTSPVPDLLCSIPPFWKNLARTLFLVCHMILTHDKRDRFILKRKFRL